MALPLQLSGLSGGRAVPVLKPTECLVVLMGVSGGVGGPPEGMSWCCLSSGRDTTLSYIVCLHCELL